MSSAFYEKQMLLNCIGLPLDIVREIKHFVYDDKIMGESKKVKNRAISILKTAISREPSNTDAVLSLPDIIFEIHGIQFGHWAYGFANSNEVQLQAIHCLRCGNYHMLLDMTHRRYSPAVFCVCLENMPNDPYEMEVDGEETAMDDDDDHE